MIYPKHKFANYTFLGVKDTQIWAEKGRPFKRLKLPRLFPIDRE